MYLVFGGCLCISYFSASIWGMYLTLGGICYLFGILGHVFSILEYVFDISGGMF